MRKAISLFLATVVLCMSASAMAAIETSGTDIGRNNQSSLGSTYGGIETTMPGFRPGDTVSFNITGVTSSNELTLICYKYGAESDGLTGSEVSYINQYTLASGTQSISYRIPNDTTSGVYKIVINDSAQAVATFYYKVGKVTVAMIGNANGTPYRKLQFGDEWSIAFIGKVTVDSGDVTLAELGANPGFVITESGGKTKKYGFGVDGNTTVAALQGVTTGSNAKILEVAGGYSFIYGLTMYNVTDGHQNSITAAATTDADE